MILTGWAGDDAPVLELLEVCRRRAIPVRLAPTTAELLSHSRPGRPGARAAAVRPAAAGARRRRVPAKRGSTWWWGRCIGLIAAPVLAVAAIAIKLEDGGPVIHRSRRVGVEEHEFTLPQAAHDARGRGGASRTSSRRPTRRTGRSSRSRDDPRVTRVGAVLRRFSIDELPQLWNVLRGEMSLVGPRPLPLRDYELLDDLHKKRYLVLPGHDRPVAGVAGAATCRSTSWCGSTSSTSRPGRCGSTSRSWRGRSRWSSAAGGPTDRGGRAAPAPPTRTSSCGALRRAAGEPPLQPLRAGATRPRPRGGGPRAAVVSGSARAVLRLIAPSLGDLLGQLERDRHRTRAEIARLEARVAELERARADAGLMRVAFVVQRYGEEVAGGAEALCRATARALAERGDAVEVLHHHRARLPHLGAPLPAGRASGTGP